MVIHLIVKKVNKICNDTNRKKAFQKKYKCKDFPKNACDEDKMYPVKPDPNVAKAVLKYAEENMAVVRVRCKYLSSF